MHGPKCTQQRAPTPVLQPWERSCSGCYRLATWGKPAGSEDPRAQDISAPSRGSCQRVGSRARGIPSAALSRSREQRGRGVVTALTWGTHQAPCVWVPPRDYRSVNGVSQSCKFSGDEKPISRLLPQNSVLPDACAVWRWLFKEVSRVRWRLRVGLLQHGRGHGDKTSPGTRAGRVGGGGRGEMGAQGPSCAQPALQASAEDRVTHRAGQAGTRQTLSPGAVSRVAALVRSQPPGGFVGVLAAGTGSPSSLRGVLHASQAQGGFQSLEGRGPVSTLNSRPPRGPFPSPGLTPSLHSACAALGLDGQSPCSRAMCVPMARVYPPNSGREVHVHVHLELRRLPIASSPLRAARSPPTPRGSGSRTCASASPARQVTQVTRKPRMIGRPAGAPYALHPFALQVAAGAPLWRPEASVRRWSRITLPARTGDRERQMCIKKNSFTN